MVKVLVYSNPRHILAFSSTASYSNLDTLSQVCSQALQQSLLQLLDTLISDERTALKHRAAANIATTSLSKLGYVVVPLFLSCLSTCTFEKPYQYLFFSIPFSSLSSMLCSSKCPVILSRTCVIITNQFKNDHQISITKLTPYK